MADDSIVTMLKAVQTKLRTASLILDPANVILGEKDPHSLEAFDDDQYPRLETLITKLRINDYPDQKTLDQDFRISTAGYLRRAEHEFTEQDMYDIMNFGTEVTSLLFSFNDDALAGFPPTDGFLFVGGFSDLFMEPEFITKTAAFIIEVEFKLNLTTVGRE